MSTVTQELEDDVPELIDWLIVQELQGDSVHTTKDQLRDALIKLIDERIQAAISRPTCLPKIDAHLLDNDKT